MIFLREKKRIAKCIEWKRITKQKRLIIHSTNTRYLCFNINLINLLWYFDNLQSLAEIIELCGHTAYFKSETTKLGPLSKKAAKRLVKVIVDWTVREFVWLSLKDFPKVFEKIKELIPRESICLYFIPKEEGNNPSGLLYNSFRRRHQLLREETGIRRNQKSQEKKAPLAFNQEQLPVEVDLIRQRLISRSEPWSSIMEDWKATFNYRRNEIMSIHLADIFNRWPKFKHKKGMEMVILFILLVETFKFLNLEYPIHQNLISE